MCWRGRPHTQLELLDGFHASAAVWIQGADDSTTASTNQCHSSDQPGHQLELTTGSFLTSSPQATVRQAKKGNPRHRRDRLRLVLMAFEMMHDDA